VLVVAALVAAGGAVLVLTPPTVHMARTAWSDRDTRSPLAPGVVDDASHLNATRVREVVTVADEPAAAIAQLSALLERAAREDLPVAIAGARHTMGGHTISPDGIALEMAALSHMRLDDERDVLTVGAGALWSDVIAYLDARGRSVAIMQSNASFTVGGSISANCHGWQHGRPPIATTVRRLRLVRADGGVVECSREINAELFSLVLGGYGLFGVIVEVDLDVVENRRYAVDRMVIPADELAARFEREVAELPEAGLVYGRFCVTADAFLEEVILNVFRDSPCPPEQMPALTEPSLVGIKRTIFRGSIDSAYGKELRWDAERTLSQHLAGRYFSRNQLLNEGVEIYENRSGRSTDILHEYFVAPAELNGFLDDMRRLVPPHDADLLNVTVRHVLADEDTFLRYADREMFALVCLFNQGLTDEAERDMQSLTRQLIDAVLERNGRYYLPYRLHATRDQFRRAYPQGAAFFEMKRRYDPDERFRNLFYAAYGDG
jgi:FAD/FMN-containing dehydrogenase